jgi:hypothetical protein
MVDFLLFVPSGCKSCFGVFRKGFFLLVQMLRLSSIVLGFRVRVVDDRESFQNVSHMGLVIFQSFCWARKTKNIFEQTSFQSGGYMLPDGIWATHLQNKSTIRTHKGLSAHSNREVMVAQWNQLSISYKSCGSKGCWVFTISDHSLFAPEVFVLQGWLLLEDF